MPRGAATAITSRNVSPVPSAAILSSRPNIDGHSYAGSAQLDQPPRGPLRRPAGGGEHPCRGSRSARGADGRAAQTRPPAGATLLDPHPGEVSERLKERDWKSRGREIPASRVRIPPSPLNRPAPGGWGRGT